MNINHVVLGGNLVRDPETRYTQSGVAIGSFTIANNRKYQRKGGGLDDETSFIGCTAFGKTAENISQYFRKGNRIIVQGRLSQETWEDKSTGQKREKTKVVVERFEFVDRSSDRQQSDRPQIRQQAPASSQVQGASEDSDDLPF